MAESALGRPGAPLSYATGDLPGCGGRLKAGPGDFLVEELPAYEPCGRGEHLYLWIEKRGISTAAVTAALARRLGVAPAALGTAGKKDAQAVARQWISVHTPDDPDPATLAGEGFTVLAARRHGNKLRPGHLRGNRFSVSVRGAGPPAAAEAVLARIAPTGFPAYFGPQRLGPRLATALAGRALVLGTRRPGRDLERMRFAVNAYQGALFNALVERRLRTLGDLERLLPGDLAVLHRNGAAFAVDAAGLAEAQSRAAAHELSASAPLFGTHVTLAAGEPGSWERELLAAEGLGPDAFRLGGKRLSPKGERRAVRAFAEELAWDWADEEGEPVLRLRFTLGPGVYATALLRELMKNDDLSGLAPAQQLPESGAGTG
jgi:tRNA pseudouridine13 synthase